TDKLWCRFDGQQQFVVAIPFVRKWLFRIARMVDDDIECHVNLSFGQNGDESESQRIAAPPRTGIRTFDGGRSTPRRTSDSAAPRRITRAGRGVDKRRCGQRQLIAPSGTPQYLAHEKSARSHESSWQHGWSNRVAEQGDYVAPAQRIR